MPEGGRGDLRPKRMNAPFPASGNRTGLFFLCSEKPQRGLLRKAKTGLQTTLPVILAKETRHFSIFPFETIQLQRRLSSERFLREGFEATDPRRSGALQRRPGLGPPASSGRLHRKQAVFDAPSHSSIPIRSEKGTTVIQVERIEIRRR